MPTEHKPGDVVKFVIGGKELVVEPVPYGNLKKIMRLVSEAADSVSGTSVLKVNVLFEKYVDEFVPLLFNTKSHPWLDTAWIDENLTVPKMREIFETAVAVNGLKDFLGRRGPAQAVDAPTSETPATQPASTSSTTPSA